MRFNNNKRYEPWYKNAEDLGRFIKNYCSSLTLNDKLLVKEAVKKLREVYQYGRHHAVSIGRGESGTIYTGWHMYAEVKESSSCAEKGLLHKAVEAGDKLEFIATVLQQKPEDGGKVIIVSPCAQCREQLLTFAPTAEIVIEVKRGLFLNVCSVEAIYPWPSHPRC